MTSYKTLINGSRWLISAACLSFTVAFGHVAVVFIGAPAYRYFGAGEEIAELAASGSILPAVLTLLLAAVFAVWGLYALSGAGLIRRLPLLGAGLVAIAGIYALRGLGIVTQVVWMIRSPRSVPLRETAFSLASLFIGIVYFIGVISSWETLKADRRAVDLLPSNVVTSSR